MVGSLQRAFKRLIYIYLIHMVTWLALLLMFPPNFGQGQLSAQSREAQTATARAVDQLDNRVDRVERSDSDQHASIMVLETAVKSLSKQVDHVVEEVSKTNQNMLDFSTYLYRTSLLVMSTFILILGGTVWSMRRVWTDKKSGA